jgi:hypothetical protein
MKQITFILFSVLILSCNPVEIKDENYTTIVQGLPSINDIIEFDEYFEISEIIPLETN